MLTTLILASLYTCQTQNMDTGIVYTESDSDIIWAQAQASDDCAVDTDYPDHCQDLGCTQGLHTLSPEFKAESILK